MADDTEIYHIIASLYEAAAEPERWPAAMTALGDLFNAVSSQFLLWDKRAHTPAFLVFRDDAPPEVSEDYDRHYGALNPRRHLVERLPVGTLVADHERSDDAFVRREELDQDYLHPLDVRYAAGGRALETPELSAVVAVIRAPEQGPFLPEEMALLERLVPHLARAARLHDRLRRAELRGRSAVAVLDRLPFAAVIADTAGRVLALNRTAEELARAADGFVVRNGRLGATRPDEEAALLSRVADAALTAARRGGQGGGALLVSRPSGGYPHVVLTVPLDPEATSGAPTAIPAALVLINDTERRPGLPGRSLVELFGLTPAEARLAVDLLEGRRLEEIAGERGVRMTTLRSQLSAILAKTGAARQMDLMRLLAGLPSVREFG